MVSPAHADGGFSTPYDEDAVEADLIDPDDATLSDDDPLSAHAAGAATTSDRAPLTGNISNPQARARQTQSYLTSSIPGEDRRAPQNTLDESVWATLSRDLLAVWEKMKQVLYPKYLLGGAMNGVASDGDGVAGGGLERLRGLVGRFADGDVVLQGNMSEGLRDWDLWGPLLFCLLLSFLLSRGAQDEQKIAVFTGVFAIVWIGEAVVTLQIKLLGGNISFFQSVCIIGYTLFPLVIASLLSAFGLNFYIRIPIYAVLILWSMAAGVSILNGSGVVKNRVGIAVYPLLVFYIGLGCLCLIS